MKKITLSLLALAFLTTGAIAQNSVSTSVQSLPATVSPNLAAPTVTTGHHSTAKPGRNARKSVYYSTTFAEDIENYSTGTYTGYPDSTDTYYAPTHQQNGYYSTWRRWADTSYNTISSMSNYYCYLTSNGWWRSVQYLTSHTPNNGFMLMSMLDQLCDNRTGGFDAYIAFPGFSTVGSNGIQLRFYQYYRCFNWDRCYVDYSTDSLNWQSIEINVRDVDLASNSSIRGEKTVPLPLSLAGQSQVYLRLRWASNYNGGGAYGYFWMVDDVTVEDLPAFSLTATAQQIYGGAYGIMPVGFRTPLTYGATVKNTGTTTLTDLRAYVEHPASSNTIGERGYYSLSYLQQRRLMMDFSGYFYNMAMDSTWNGSACSSGYTTGTALYNGGCLPTTTAGTDSIYAFVYSPTSNDGVTVTSTDTIVYRYQVAAADEEGNSIWAWDNGTLNRNAYYANGRTSNNYYTTDPNQGGCFNNGYTVRLRYRTGDSIPDGWVIRGIELVPDMVFTQVGATITPSLSYDSCTYEYIMFINISTGVSNQPYTVTANDLTDTTGFTSATYGNYNSIRIMFPEQPELRPNTAYRLGYQLSEGQFLVATDNNTISDIHTQDIYAYGNQDGVGSYGNAKIAGDNSHPMIRMIVGPRRAIPQYGITFNCPSDVAVPINILKDDNETISCNSTDSVAQGGSYSYTIVPDNGLIRISHIYVDGEEVEFTTSDETDGNGDYIRTLAFFTLNNVQDHHTVSIEAENNCDVPYLSLSSTHRDYVKLYLYSTLPVSRTFLLQYRAVDSTQWNTLEIENEGYPTLEEGTHLTRGVNYIARAGKVCVEDTVWSEDTVTFALPLCVAPSATVTDITANSVTFHIEDNGSYPEWTVAFRHAYTEEWTNYIASHDRENIPNYNYTLDHLLPNLQYIVRFGTPCQVVDGEEVRDTTYWSEELTVTPSANATSGVIEVTFGNNTYWTSGWALSGYINEVTGIELFAFQNQGVFPYILFVQMSTDTGTFTYSGATTYYWDSPRTAELQYGQRTQVQVQDDGNYWGDWWGQSATVHITELSDGVLSGTITATMARVVNDNNEYIGMENATETQQLTININRLRLNINGGAPTRVPEIAQVQALSNNAAMGSVSGSGIYAKGATATLSAYAQNGYQFSGWSNGTTANPLSLTIDGDTTVTAYFAAANGGLTHDTTIITVHDTTFTTVHDTTFTTVYDTTYLTLHDTTIVTLHDTIATDTAYIIQVQYDTIRISDTVSIVEIQYDTVYMSNDSVYTWQITSANEAQGRTVGSGSYYAGQSIGIAALPAAGYRFVSWSDGDTGNPRTLTVTGNLTLTASFEEDAVGVNAVTASGAKVWSHQDCIYVRDAQGMSINVYDEWGRCLVSTPMNTDVQKIFRMPASGVYMVKIGNDPAKQVVIMR